jgi:hypothetical protein
MDRDVGAGAFWVFAMLNLAAVVFHLDLPDYAKCNSQSVVSRRVSLTSAR